MENRLSFSEACLNDEYKIVVISQCYGRDTITSSEDCFHICAWQALGMEVENDRFDILVKEFVRVGAGAYREG